MKLPQFKIKKLHYKLPSRRDWLMLGIGALIATFGIRMGYLMTHPQKPLKPVSSQVTIPWLPETVKRWEGPIGEMAKKYNIDPNLIAIIITLESGGYSKASSDADAHGLMQVTTPTAQDIAKKFLKNPQANYNLDDPRTNIEFGAAYLSYLRNELGEPGQGPTWNSTVELIAAGYNGGPRAANNLEKGNGLTDTQTVVYSRDVYNMWREQHASRSPTFDRWLERGGSHLIDQAKAEK